MLPCERWPLTQILIHLFWKPSLHRYAACSISNVHIQITHFTVHNPLKEHRILIFLILTSILQMVQMVFKQLQIFSHWKTFILLRNLMKNHLYRMKKKKQCDCLHLYFHAIKKFTTTIKNFSLRELFFSIVRLHIRRRFDYEIHTNFTWASKKQ